MTHVQKGVKYTLKNLLGKTREENDLRMKVLRYVMAVGFVLSPWLGGEAYAAGIERIDNITLPNGLDKTYLQNGSNVAHIYAEKASGDVGLNRFKTFEVGANQIANLYFKTSATDTNHLNTLVNTVQERISISGIVNGIRNNEVGGKLYFLSPNGMVVGAGGVINAGQLTVIATDKTFQNAEEAADVSWASGNWALKQAASIDIQGQINAKTGIDLRALSIAVSKAPNSGINPYLKTGMLFNTIVNTDGLVKEVTLQNRDNTLVDNGIQLQAYQDLGGDDKFFGSITLSGCDVDALGEINITSGESFNITNNSNIKTNNAITIDLEHTNTNNQHVGNFVFESGRIEAGGMPYITIGDSINISNGATFVSTLVTTDTINFKAHQGSIYNYGNIQMQSTLNMQAGIGASGGTPCLINSGTIQSQGGGLSLTAKNNITNNGTIEANAQIKFAVGGTLTNQGTIESTSSNVQAHIGRDFKNIAKPDPSDSSKLIGGIIKAGGNVQVDYNLDNEGIGVASSEERIDGIYNSGLLQANGDEDPTSTGGFVDKNSGSGNIWLTSSYNITNYGTMEANRQITLNARDFLDNYGLIQGVTYLDIKSIMGYVYNHGTDNNGNAMNPPGRIIATGGNIALSSGQANLDIQGDDGTKKELYRKFTPIIIEGIVEATSDLNNVSSETKQGNINITAYLGDIYVVEGTIRANAKPVTSGEKESAAGDVILDAAQNITIGFKTEYAEADDPTTDNKDGHHPEYVSNTERGYYKPKSDYPLDPDPFPTYPSGKDVTISGSNIKLTSGDNEKYYILISNTTTGSNALPASNTLTASNAITINTDSMNIVGGTFNADTLAASKNLNIAGGTINTNNIIAGITDGVNNGGQLTITGGAITTSNVTAGGQLSVMSGVSSTGSLSLNGVEAVTIGGSAGISSSGDLSVTSNGSVMISGNAGASDEAIVQAGGDVSVTSTTGNIQNSKVITAGKNVSMTATQGSVENSRAITAGTSAVDIGNIELTAGNGISLTNAYELTADGTVELNTANMNITTGTINADTLAASGALTISGVGTINAANVTAGGAMSIAGGTIKTGTSQGSFTATSINMSSGSITGKDVIISADEQVQLQGGSLVANAATLEVKKNTSGDSIVESANGFTLDVDSLSVSANKGAIKLNGSGNVLQSVTLANAGGNVEIVNGNATNNNALTVSTAEGTTVNGTISIDNKGAGITVTGVNARDAVNLTAGANITVAGDVAATNASFGAGVDFIHNSGAIAAGEVVVTAGQNVKLNGGSMVSGKSASLTAGTAGENLAESQGFIAEQDGYAIDAPQLTASAAKYATLGSSANQLAIVDATQVGGDLTIGSGNTKSDAALQIATAGTIQGDLTVINYASNGDAKANEIVFGNNLKAIGNIVLNNQETDINIGQGLTITSASESVTISSAGNVNLAGTIDVKNVNITADEAISQTAGSIVATNTVATAGSDLSLASSANKLQNVTVKADDGSVIIVSGNDKAGDLNVKTDGTIGGTLSITNVANGAENDIVIEQNLLANGSIIINNQEAGINLGENVGITSHIGGISITALKDLISAGIINAVNDVILKAINNNLNMSGGSITATGGSINLSGTGGINNGASITAKGNVGLYSTGGSIINSADITAGKNFVQATRRAALFSLRALAEEPEETGSVIINGNGGVTNTESANISATQNVSITSATGNISNSGTIEANQNVGMTATTGTVTNSNDVNAGTGTVTMSGKTGVVNDNASATISAGSGVSMKSSDESVTNSSTVTSTTGVVEMNGQKTVTNSGAVTASGGSVEISGSSVANTGAVTASGGSVTMSGNDGVTNKANITANKNVNISADAGAITNSGSVTANTGDIDLSSKDGITSTGNGASLKTESLNGSISAATTYGEVNISEITAGDTASVSSENGSVIIGSVSGNDVVLSSGPSSSGGSGDGSEGGSGGSETSHPSIEVGTAKVDNSLKLQGDNITVSNVASSNPTGNNTLTVDVNGAGGADTAVQGSLNLNITGDVVIDNLNVTKAEVTASGNIDVNKIGVDDKGQAQLTSNKKTENDSGTTVTVVGKDATPDAGSGNVIVAPGNDSDTWLKIEMNEEGSKTTVVNDPGSNDYPAQMSAKLVDYDPYDTYLDHYADMVDIFSRSYLIDAPERSSSDILFPAQGGRIVLKQDANGLHLEISEEDKEA